MTEPKPEHVLPVSNDPAHALSQVVLDELNRMNSRIHEQDKLIAALVDRVNVLYAAFSALGKPPQ